MLYGVSFGLDDITPPWWLDGALRKQLNTLFDRRGDLDQVDAETLYIPKMNLIRTGMGQPSFKPLVSGLRTGYWSMFDPNISSPIAEAIMGCLGQQYLHRHEVLEGYKNRKLPHFKSGDISAESRGFIKNGYRNGLNPIEFFFHAAHERSNTIAKTFQIGQTGYLQRRLIYALQDLMVNRDRSVRLMNGRIVQFSYGEDGTDPGKSSFGKAVDVNGIVEAVIEELSYFDSPDNMQSPDQPGSLNAHSPLIMHSETREDLADSCKKIPIEILSIRHFVRVYYRCHSESYGSISSWEICPSEQVVNELINSLSDDHSDVRGAAVDALSSLGDAKAVGPLIEMLNDISFDVRGKAAEGLGKLGDSSAIPKLQTLLQDPFWCVRSKTLQSLDLLRTIAAIQNITDIDESSHNNPEILYETRNMPLPILFEAQGTISSADKDVTTNSPNDLDDVENTPLYEVPTESVVDIPESEKHLIPIESLFCLLDAEDPDIRRFAVQTLGERGDARAIRQVTKLLNDTEYSVFTAALEAIEKIKSV